MGLGAHPCMCNIYVIYPPMCNIFSSAIRIRISFSFKLWNQLVLDNFHVHIKSRFSVGSIENLISNLLLDTELHKLDIIQNICHTCTRAKSFTTKFACAIIFNDNLIHLYYPYSLFRLFHTLHIDINI